jgi:sugar phosphate isomerase/epimerase
MKKVNNVFMTALALMAVLVSSFSFTSCTGTAPKKEKKDIGIQLYSVRDDMKTDPAATIAKLGEIGYTYAEAAGYNDGKFYGMDPAGFKALLEKNGMTMKGSHAGMNLPKEGEWDQAMQWWDTCIAAHKAAGAEWIVKPSMGGEAYRSLDTLKMYCDYFNTIGEKCNEAGIHFGYHNHAHEFDTVLDSQIVYNYMLENTDPAKVMFELDLYWIMKGGKNAVDYFNQYPGRFELYHVKDEKELGASGTMDFKTVFDMAEKAGMKNYVVEVERYDFEPIVSVQKSFEFLNNAGYVK